MHDAVVRLPLCLLADSRLDQFPEAGLVVRMNPLKEFFESGQTILWIETQNTVAFLRPVPDILVRTPCPASRLAEFLRLGKISLALTQLLLRALAVEEQLQIELRVQHKRFGNKDEQDRDRGHN